MRGAFATAWLPLLFAALCLSVSVWFCPLALAGVLDCIARFRERAYIRRKGYSKRLALFFRHSRCQRNMFTSVYPQAAALYADLGYRWWHILPDKLVKTPREFFSIKHVRATIGL